MRPVFKFILQISLILFFVITVTTSIDNFLNKDIKKMTELSNDIEENILSSNYDEVLESLEKLDKIWEKSKIKWCWMIHHTLIREVEVSVSNFSEYIKNEMFDEAIVEKRKLEKQFETISDMDKLKIYHIL